MSANTDSGSSAASDSSAAEDAAAVPLDLLLGDAATGMLRRLNLGGSGLRLAAALAVRPRLVAGRGRQLAGELARIGVGRFQGPPVPRAPTQADRAAAESVAGVVAEAGLDEADSERVNFVLTNLIDALSPSNN